MPNEAAITAAATRQIWEQISKAILDSRAAETVGAERDPVSQAKIRWLHLFREEIEAASKFADLVEAGTALAPSEIEEGYRLMEKLLEIRTRGIQVAEDLQPA